MPINNVSSVDNLGLVVGLIEKSLRPQEGWFNLKTNHDIQSVVREGKDIFGKYLDEYNKAFKLFEEEIYDERIYNIFERCESKYQSYMRIFNGTYKKDLKWLRANLKSNDKIDFDTFHKYIRNIKRVMDYKKSITQKESDFKTSFGWHYQEFDTNWAQIEQALAVTRDIVEWHQGKSITVSLKDLLIQPAGRVEQLLASYNQLKQISNDLQQTVVLLQTEFPNLINLICSNVATVNVEELNTNLQVEWRKVESYYLFVNEFTNHLLNPMYLNISGLKEDLKRLIELNQEINKVEDDITNTTKVLGNSFKGKDTDWDRLLEFMDAFGNLYRYNIEINQEFKNAMLQGGLHFPLDEAELRNCISKIEKDMLLYIAVIPKAFSGLEGVEHFWKISAFSSRLLMLKQKVTEWQDWFAKVSPYFIRSLSIYEAKAALEKAVQIKGLKECLDSELENLKYVFGDHFTGYTTNWEQIFDALAWTDEWHELFVGVDMPDQIIDFVGAEGKRDKNELKGVLTEAKRAYEETLILEKDFHIYFTISVIFKANFSSIALSELIHFAEMRLSAIDLLEDWIRYQRLEKQATDNGLNQFMLAIKQEEIGEYKFKDLFQKRFFLSSGWIKFINKNHCFMTLMQT